MSKKIVTAATRLASPIMTVTTVKLREAVEQVARQQRVSIAEIGRRALSDYVKATSQKKA